MLFKRTLVAGALSLGLVATGALAASWFDGGGTILPSAVMHWLNGSNVATPVSAANPMPVAISSGGGGPVTQGTSPWVDNVSQFGGSPILTGTGVGGAGVPRMTISSDSTIGLTGTLPAFGATPTFNIGTAPTLTISNTTFASTQSGSWNVGGLGVGGTPSGGVVSVQGVASMTALKTDGSATTQPVSATALPLPTGAATSAIQSSVIGTLGAGAAAASSVAIGGVYNSTLPALTSGQQSAVQLDAAGRQIVTVAPYAYAPLTPGQHNVAITTATLLTVPSGSTYATVCASTANVKYTTDGTTTPTSTIGMTLATGACVTLSGATVVANFKAISATGTLDSEYFK